MVDELIWNPDKGDDVPEVPPAQASDFKPVTLYWKPQYIKIYDPYNFWGGMIGSVDPMVNGDCEDDEGDDG